MSPHLLVWIAALIMQSALLGRNMFAVSVVVLACARRGAMVALALRTV
jgi:hypothetical protein